jgi:hypothetical protein
MGLEDLRVSPKYRTWQPKGGPRDVTILIRYWGIGIGIGIVTSLGGPKYKRWASKGIAKI